jgi:hypothetical protein
MVLPNPLPPELEELLDEEELEELELLDELDELELEVLDDELELLLLGVVPPQAAKAPTVRHRVVILNREKFAFPKRLIIIKDTY